MAYGKHPLTRRATLRAVAGGALTGRALAATVLAVPLTLCNAADLRALPRRYRLDPDRSKVGFDMVIGGVKSSGTMPVLAADVVVDPDKLAATQADVTLNTAQAEAGFTLASEAMRSPEILDVARYPQARFLLTRVQLAASGRLSDGARVTGRLTLRDVTLPITLSADLYRAPGSAPGDLSRLSIRLAGAISRSAFGAAGYRALVEDKITLDIFAQLVQTG